VEIITKRGQYDGKNTEITLMESGWSNINSICDRNGNTVNHNLNLVTATYRTMKICSWYI